MCNYPLRALGVLPYIVLAALMTLPVLSYGQQNERRTLNIQDRFTASGYMGDGEYGTKYISFEGAWKNHPHSEPTCIKVTYTFGPVRWAGVYWQNEPDNWGDEPGEDFSREGFSRVTFRARGETGNEVLEFKSGKIRNENKKYRDSHGGTTGQVTLTTEWKKYEIDLGGQDLSCVIGGFCWVASKDYNRSSRLVFYLDDINFE